MSSFTSPLKVLSLPNGRDWEVLEEFDYHVGTKESDKVVHVPVGFVTDFASTDILQWLSILLTVVYACLSWFTSIPAWVGTIFLAIILAGQLITPYGKHGKAAVLHDFLYKTKQISKPMSDLIFYEAMVVAKSAVWRAWLMYQGVHLFGWLAWKKE